MVHSRIEDLRRRVAADPASIAFAQLAEEYRRAGAFDEAVTVCRAGLAKHPGYLSARVTLGRALLELGELDAAGQELQAVLNGAPDNRAAIRGLADIRQRQGRLEEALAHYRRALDLARNDPDLQQHVAELTSQLTCVPLAAASQSRNAPTTDTGGLLTFEQLTRELQQASHLARNTSPAAGKAEPRPASTSMAKAMENGDPAAEAGRNRLAMLQRWLMAIDGFRAERHA